MHDKYTRVHDNNRNSTKNNLNQQVKINKNAIVSGEGWAWGWRLHGMPAACLFYGKLWGHGASHRKRKIPILIRKYCFVKETKKKKFDCFVTFQLEYGIANISALINLRRLDKKKDRVEISPEQLLNATVEAERLTMELKRPMRVLGWYHSHPHITVCPSHVGKNCIPIFLEYFYLLFFMYTVHFND